MTAESAAWKHASHLLADHLRRLGISKPADGPWQFQVEVLRSLLAKLDVIMQDEQPPIPEAQRDRIMRCLLYGGVPGAAEAGLRDEITDLTRSVSRNGGISQAPVWVPSGPI